MMPLCEFAPIGEDPYYEDVSRTRDYLGGSSLLKRIAAHPKGFKVTPLNGSQLIVYVLAVNGVWCIAYFIFNRRSAPNLVYYSVKPEDSARFSDVVKVLETDFGLKLP